MKRPACLSGILLLAPIASAGNVSTTTPERHAHDANAGWIDFAPPIADALTVGNYFLKGYAYSANYGWLHFGNGPANKRAYTYTGGEYGVNSDPATGRLTGYAYAANIGWIHFGWAGVNDPNRPRVSPVDGVFAGHAWSPNTGWISLSRPRATSLAIADEDGDQIDDAWEILHFGNLTAAGIGTDWDKDGQSDAAEFTAGTLPKDNASWLRITSYTPTSGPTTHTITFTCTNTRLYRIWTSTTLAAASWAVAPAPVYGSAPFPGASTPTMTVTCTQPAAPARFFRVIATKY